MHGSPEGARPVSHPEQWVPRAWPFCHSPLTRVMSREAAAALMCRLGCRTELLQSRARANVPTELGRETGADPGRPRGGAGTQECSPSRLKGPQG